MEEIHPVYSEICQRSEANKQSFRHDFISKLHTGFSHECAVIICSGKQHFCIKQRLDSVRKLHSGWAQSWRKAAAPFHDRLWNYCLWLEFTRHNTRFMDYSHELVILFCKSCKKSKKKYVFGQASMPNVPLCWCNILSGLQLSLIVFSSLINAPCEVLWGILAALALKQDHISDSPST